MDADGGNQRRLTNNPFAEWHPSWSPDGKRIAFTSDVDWHTHIYVMDANGKNLRSSVNTKILAAIPHGLRDGNGLSSLLIGWAPCGNLCDGRRWEESTETH